MDSKKMRLILETMKGITYSDWKKLKHCIDTRFNADTSAAANKVLLADVNTIVGDYLRES